jgi:hypothetical protein
MHVVIALTIASLMASTQASDQMQSVQIVTSGRDFAELTDDVQIFSGRCDGREVSVTVVERSRDGRPGHIVLRGGDFRVSAPPEFQDGALSGSAVFRGETACDGNRLAFRAIVIRQDDAGRIVMRDQTLYLDMLNGALRMTRPRLLSQDEIRFQLQHGGDNPVHWSEQVAAE